MPEGRKRGPAGIPGSARVPEVTGNTAHYAVQKCDQADEGDQHRATLTAIFRPTASPDAAASITFAALVSSN